MKKILLLGNSLELRKGYDNPKSLSEAIGSYFKQGKLYYSSLSNIYITAQNGTVNILDTHNDMPLADYDLVFFMGWYKKWTDQVLAIATYLKANNVDFFNSEALVQRSRGKISQSVIFGLHNLPIPKTAYKAVWTPKDYITLVDYLGEGFVFKQFDGSKGNNNYLVSSKAEYTELLVKYAEQETQFIAQECIPNTGDIRLICSGNKTYMILARKSDNGSHLHNTSQGASAVLLDPESLDVAVNTACLKAAKLLNRDFCGIDLIQNAHTGEYFILEANNQPQLVSGAFSEDKAKIFSQIITDRLVS